MVTRFGSWSSLALLAAVLAPPGAPAGEGALGLEWKQVFGSLEFGMCNDLYRVDRTLDGNYIFAANTANYDGEGGLISLAKTDLSGRLIWGNDYGYGEGRWISPAVDGGYFACGWGGKLVIKVDGAGSLVWEALGKIEMRFPNCVTGTSDGGCAACGSWNGEMVARFDASGELLWERTYGEGWAYRIIEARDGALVVLATGRRADDFSRDRIHVMRLDASGEIIWEKSLVGLATRRELGYAAGDCSGEGGLIGTEDGDIVVAAWGWAPDLRQMFGIVIRLDGAGTVLWQKDILDVGYLLSVTRARDGDLLIAGLGEDFSRLCSLEENGDLAWGADIPFRLVKPRSILETEDGGFLLGGYDEDRMAVLAKFKIGIEGEPHFIRGDFDGDGEMTISDPIGLLSHLFLGEQSDCRKAADFDDGGTLDLSDAVGALTYLFLGGPAPAMPHPGCGMDPTPDDLDCRFSLCDD
jgi:hypothetical protein